MLESIRRLLNEAAAEEGAEEDNTRAAPEGIQARLREEKRKRKERKREEEDLKSSGVMAGRRQALREAERG